MQIPALRLVVFGFVLSLSFGCAPAGESPKADTAAPAPAKPAAPAAEKSPAEKSPAPPPEKEKEKDKGPDLKARLDAGAKAYAVACVACHQANGEGIPSVYPPLVESEWVSGSETRLIAILLHGLTGPITVKGVPYPGIPMPAFAEGSTFNWSDEQIADVLTYIRHSWGNAAAPVAVENVTALRKKMGRRAEMTEAELKELP